MAGKSSVGLVAGLIWSLLTMIKEVRERAGGTDGWVTREGISNRAAADSHEASEMLFGTGAGRKKSKSVWKRLSTKKG